MEAIIDVPQNVARHAEAMYLAGVRTVIRYYSHQNSSSLPTKCLTKAEADTLHAAGISVAVVFQQRGGAWGEISDLTAATGERDATRALDLAAEVGQPEGSGIYLAVDWDYHFADDLKSIGAYFDAARKVLGSRYRLGCYGSGLVQIHASAELRWLANAKAWHGTKAALEAGQYDLRQHLPKRAPMGFDYDPNEARVTDFGQWPVTAGHQPGPEQTLAQRRTDAVRGIQTVLQEHGFDPGPVDGIPGPLTRAGLAKVGL